MKYQISDLTDLGGFSGSPAFLFSDGELHLVGVVHENIEQFEYGVKCVKTTFLSSDGTLKKQ